MQRNLLNNLKIATCFFPDIKKKYFLVFLIKLFITQSFFEFFNDQFNTNSFNTNYTLNKYFPHNKNNRNNRNNKNNRNNEESKLSIYSKKKKIIMENQLRKILKKINKKCLNKPMSKNINFSIICLQTIVASIFAKMGSDLYNKIKLFFIK